MKFVASQKVVYQINDNEFETVSENMIFDETDTFAKMAEWGTRKICAFYRSPVIQITMID